MNAYTYEQLQIGQRESFISEVTEDKIHNFYKMTEDSNPLHATEDFAINQGFEGRVVYGMLTASLLSTLAGVYLPGKYSLIHEVNVIFVKPVYLGDKLTVSGEVISKDDRYRFFILRAEIFNQNNEKVLRGSMKIGVMEDQTQFRKG